MAKGVEDTAFYDFNRLVSLNEVGGDPGVFGIAPEEFHRLCTEAQKSHPRKMLASSTHDTKRSEDVRARISVLSEIPAEWRKTVHRWSEMNSKYKQNNYPDPNTEYLIYQTMIGAWPIETDRLLPYLEKATREAKQETNWLTPNEQFESATKDFVGNIYKDEGFRRDFEAFVASLVEPGRINALGQTLLKLTTPGIPDTYQGTELWDLSLVDPDNRRPVDYDLRRRLLQELDKLTPQDIWKRVDEGLPKMWLIRQALRVRKDHPEAFGPEGDYKPLSASGDKARHVLAFGRGVNVVVLLPLLVKQLNSDWGNTSIAIPEGKWHDVFSQSHINGGTLKLDNLLKTFPVALLVKE
jgi:(1->4)-alpha-D-glucan 1-alpha-D-glucosylmutase